MLDASLVREVGAWLRRAPLLRVILGLVWLVHSAVRMLSCGRRARPWTVALADDAGVALCRQTQCCQRVAGEDKEDEDRAADVHFEDVAHRAGLASTLPEYARSELALLAAGLPLGRTLQKKLCVERLLRRRPEVAASPLPRAVWIVSLPRTGSTWLHKLLALDAGARPMRAWELRQPVACAVDCGPSKAERRAFIKRTMEALYRFLPRFKKIHHVRFDEPDECVNGFADGWFPDHWLWGMVDMPNTRDAYLHTSMVPQYANFKKLLQAVTFFDHDDDEDISDHRDGDGDGDGDGDRDGDCDGDRDGDRDGDCDGRGGGDHVMSSKHLLLKSPHHIVCLDEIASVFPGSVVLWLTRDACDVVGSCCSMNQAVLDSSCPWFFDSRELGRRTCSHLAAAAAKGERDKARLEAEAEAEAEGKLTFVDISYRDLQRDPVATIKAAYALAQLPWTVAFEDALCRSIAGRPPVPKGARHAYSLDDFGLTPDQVRATFSDVT